MTGRGQCLVLLLFSAILLLQVVKSHRKLPMEAPVAFVRYTGPQRLVRLEGAFASAGVYKIPDGVALMDVINMAVPKVFPEGADASALGRKMSQGDIVNLSLKGGQQPEITFSKMKTRERLLLGMPLDLKEMSYAEWLLVPGIGPGLASEIIKFRQNYGGFVRVEELRQVNGIGTVKADKLIKIFYHTVND